MPTTTRTVYLTDENGNPLIDEQRNLRTLSFALVQGYSYRLVERASIVSATYAQVVGYSTATGQTITGVENASEFDVGDFGIVQYAISDRNNTIGYVTCEVTAVGTTSLTVNGIGISVSGADGKEGVPGQPGPDGVGIADVDLQGLKFTFTYTDGDTDEVPIDTQDIAIVRELGTVDGADTVKMPDGSYKSIKEAILALAYPVGTIYASVNNTSPASFLGGTWEALTTDATEYKWKRTA